MSSQVQLTETFAREGVQTQEKAKTDATLRASLEQLAQLLELLAEEETEDGTTATSATKDKMVSEVLNRFGPLLSQYMSSDPAKAHHLVSSFASLLNEYANGSKEAQDKIVATLKPIILKYVAENPGKEVQVLQFFAPILRDAGGDAARAHLVRGYKNILELAVAVKGPNGAEVQKEIEEATKQLFNVKPAQANALIQELVPTLKKLEAKDPSKMQHFLNHLVPLVSMYALRSPEKVKELPLDTLYALPYDQMDAQFNKLKLDAYQAPGDKDVPNLNTLMGSAMFFVQMFQQAITQSQANQDKLQIQIGDALVKAAQISQQNVEQKIADADAAQEAASKRPWWEKLVEAVVAVVAAVVAGLTLGLGACLVAVAIGAFMVSGGFDKCAQAIGDKIEEGKEDQYYNEYKAKGYSDADARQMAKEKAQAESNIWGKLIMTAVLVVFTLGAGGITTGADVAADEGAEEGAEEAIEEGANQAGGIGKYYNFAGVPSLAIAQGLGTLSSSNIWMDCLQTNPEWVKQHQTLTIILDVICQLVAAIAAGVAGKVSYSAKLDAGVAGSVNGVAGLVNNAGYILYAGYAIQGASMVFEAGMAGKRAEYLKQLAQDYEDIGALQYQLQLFLGAENMMHFTTKINNDAASGITKDAGEAMTMLERNSGSVWSTTDKVLRKTS